MTEKKPAPTDDNQYGLRHENARVSDVYANRPGGEQPVIGPASAVDSSGHRLGDISPDPGAHRSSRTGRKAAGEKDDTDTTPAAGDNKAP